MTEGPKGASLGSFYDFLADAIRIHPGPPGVAAWSCVPAFLALVLILAVLRNSGVYENSMLLGFGNLVLTGGGSAAVAWLLWRAFLAQGNPGMLLLGCGAAAWGASGLASLVGGYGPNVLITVHNLAILLSALFQLGGALYPPGAPGVPSERRPGLVAAGAAAVAFGIGLVVVATLQGATVPFFIPGEGGTLIRQMVLIAAMGALAITAVAVGRPGFGDGSPFSAWYGLAVWMVLIGLLGILLQRQAATWLGWVGRVAQFLGGAFLLLAALSADAEAPRLPTRGLPSLYRYGVACVAVAAAFALHLPFGFELETGIALMLFIPAPGLSALYGGLGPGLAATLASAILANYFWMGPRGFTLPRTSEGLALAVFVLSCLTLVLATTALQRAHARAAKAEADSREAAERARGEAALRETVRQLTRTNRELELFAYVASHDLQEPLRMVRAYVGRLEHCLGADLDGRARQYLTIVQEAAGTLSVLIEDLLAYARLGWQVTETAPVDLGVCAARALRGLEAQVEAAGARVELDALPRASGDAALLTQVFHNLLVNALKFRKGPGPGIRVGARAGAVFVQDDGIGLDPAHAERIFEVFQRLHPRERFPGSGIGLSLCKKIVEGHGGRIWVESAPGEGATFFFQLPGPEDPA